MNESKNKNLIPSGPYCYDKNGLCPYWSRSKEHLPMESGYCSFIEKGDWDFRFGLLWDQVKMCKE